MKGDKRITDQLVQHRSGYDQQTVTSSEPCNQTSSQ